MPYVLQERRKELDPIVDLLADEGFLPNSTLGVLLFVFCRDCVKPSYKNYKNFCGELAQCIVEIKRRHKSFRGFLVKPIEFKEEVDFQKLLLAMTKARIKVNGDLNYILFKFCKYHIYNINDYCRELSLCIGAIQKEIVALYEDEKIKENGDV